MKIGIYVATGSFVVGGGERVPMEQARYLSKLGFDVTFITTKTNCETYMFKKFKLENKNIQIIYLPIPRTINLKEDGLSHKLCHKLYLSLTHAVQQTILRENFDIVITHYAPAAFSVPKEFLQVLFLHGVPDKFQQVNNIAIHQANKLIAVSNSVKLGWQDLFSTPQKIHVIHNGIDVNKFAPRDNVEDIDILYVGRLIKIKGIQFLLKAIKSLSANNLRIKKVFIVGKGPYSEYLMSLTKRLGLESIVKFLQNVNDDQLLKIYSRAKVCVFPSYAKEGVLTTLLEASSMSKAVVTADCCGMVDLVKNGYNGLLFEPKNCKDLATKLKLLLSKELLRKKIGKNARREILENWTWEASVNKLVDVLVDVYKSRH